MRFGETFGIVILVSRDQESRDINGVVFRYDGGVAEGTISWMRFQGL